MPWLPESPATVAATFTVIEGPSADLAFAVQFNPASLEYAITTQFDDGNGDNGARQFVKKSSGKLSMTLLFDTTDTGASVREKTVPIARLLEPAPDGDKKFAPKVEFGWGAYAFRGVVEQFKETIDFFSADGVPLRASVALTLASQNVEFRSNRHPAAAADSAARPEPVLTPPGSAPADVASRAGDPRAARGIAGASGAESLRFGTGASLAVGGSVSLAAAADFSIGASAGLSIGGGIGAGIGGSLGLGLGANVGATAAASLTATAGAAFAGLRVSPPAASVSIGSARAALLTVPGIGASTSFGPGGRAQVQAGGSLSADVGASARLDARIGFGD